MICTVKTGYTLKKRYGISPRLRAILRRKHSHKWAIEEGTDISPKAVFVTAEALLPEQRENIEKAFGCRLSGITAPPGRHLLQCDTAGYT